MKTRQYAKADKGYRMTSELEKRLEKVEEDIKHNRNMSSKFKSAREFIKYLDSL